MSFEDDFNENQNESSRQELKQWPDMAEPIGDLFARIVSSNTGTDGHVAFSLGAAHFQSSR